MPFSTEKTIAVLLNNAKSCNLHDQSITDVIADYFAAETSDDDADSTDSDDSETHGHGTLRLTAGVVNENESPKHELNAHIIALTFL